MRNKRIQVGLPPEIHARIKAIAKANKRTIIAQIEHWLITTQENQHVSPEDHRKVTGDDTIVLSFNPNIFTQALRKFANPKKKKLKRTLNQKQKKN